MTFSILIVFLSLVLLDALYVLQILFALIAILIKFFYLMELVLTSLLQSISPLLITPLVYSLILLIIFSQLAPQFHLIFLSLIKTLSVPSPVNVTQLEFVKKHSALAIMDSLDITVNLYSLINYPLFKIPSFLSIISKLNSILTPPPFQPLYHKTPFKISPHFFSK
jgi:hypothetical protein